MKKFLSLVLTLSMLLSLLTVPTLAGGVGDQTTTPTPTLEPNQALKITAQAITGTEKRNGQTYDTVSYKDTTYLVVRTKAQFLAMDDKDGVANFILADNITFAEGDFKKHGSNKNYDVAVVGGAAEDDDNATNRTIYSLHTFHLEGNGFSLNNVVPLDQKSCGLFAAPAGSKHTITNLAVNVSGGTLSANYSGVLYGETAVDPTSKNTSITIKNVIIELSESFKIAGGTGTTTTYNYGVFIAKTSVPTVFENCMLKGTLTSEASSQTKGVAGFTGCADTDTSVTFTNCKATGNYHFNGTAVAAGIFVGTAQNSTVTINSCTIDADLTAKGIKSGAFVGFSMGTSVTTFSDCTLRGTYDFAGSQSGGYVGRFENTASGALTNCTSKATVLARADRISPFVGQAYCDETIEFISCKAEGTLIGMTDEAVRIGAFIGAAGGSYRANSSADYKRTSPEIIFTGCDVVTVVIGSDITAAYVGSTAGGEGSLTFEECQNNATVYCEGVAAAWIAELTYADATAEAEVTESCTNHAKIIAKALFAGDNTTDYTAITDEALADGSIAYVIGQAQKALGVAAKYTFGQELGTDNAPVLGGKLVYRYSVNRSPEFVYTYTNTEVIDIKCQNAPCAFVQTTTPVSGRFDTRVIIAVKADRLADIASGTISVSFQKENGDPVKALTVGKKDVTAYYAVRAGEQIAQAAEGYVLIAIAVTDIPTTAWMPVEADGAVTNVQVKMSFTDANGTPIPEYTLN